MTAVKICGLRTVEHALAAATAGADLLGLVFAASRRQVTIDQAVAIVARLRQHDAGRRVRVVGVFVNEQPMRINTVAEQCGLDYVQLSGDEMPDQARAIQRPIIKALRLNGSANEQAWLDLINNQGSAVASVQRESGSTAHGAGSSVLVAPCPLLIDAHIPGSYGGTGALADWEHAARLAREQALILAGGLTHSNVAAAILQVRPWGVDVSSGVETNGIKDVAKIGSFIRAVRAVLY